MIKFEDDDPGYLLWLNQNPEGFVLNTFRPATAQYLIAHRSECGTIKGVPPNGKDWTSTTVKICSESLAELTKWAEDQFGIKPHFCRKCCPE